MTRTIFSELVDAHCHVDLLPSPVEFAASVERNRVHTIAVTNAPSVFGYTEKLATNNPYLHAAVGLHPELVPTHGDEVDQIFPYLMRTSFVGEIGLDYTATDTSVRNKQRQIFKKILAHCAQIGGKVITVHSRRAAADTLSMIGDGFPGKVILHWFTGSPKELRMAIQYGCYFSVNWAMMRSESGRRMIEEVPKERVLTESDAPFIDGRHGPGSVANCRSVLACLGASWRVNSDIATSIVQQNFLELIPKNLKL